MRTIISALVLTIASNATYAAFPVTDPLNLAQNFAQVLKQIDEFNQIKDRITFQVNSARRYANKLNGYKFSNIQNLLREIKSFRYRARRIGYSYKNIVNQFEKTYSKSNDFAGKFKTWEKQSDDSIKDAMEAQGLMEKSQGQMDDLDHALLAKKKAESSAETMQAIGEVNAVQAKQLNDLKQIIATDARARHSVVMEERAKRRQQKEHEAQLMAGFNEHKNSRPLAYFPKLGSTAPRVSR